VRLSFVVLEELYAGAGEPDLRRPFPISSFSYFEARRASTLPVSVQLPRSGIKIRRAPRREAIGVERCACYALCTSVVHELSASSEITGQKQFLRSVA